MNRCNGDAGWITEHVILTQQPSDKPAKKAGLIVDTPGGFT